MAKRTLHLDNQTQESIEISHGYGWKNFTITKDGEVIAQIANSKELKEGRSLQLEDGRTLSVQLKTKWGGYIQELEILVNGIPVPGSGTDPNQQLKQVYNLLLILAIFNAGLGFIAVLTDVPLLRSLGLGGGTIFMGLLYALLAYLAKYKHSVAALYTAAGIMILDMVLSLVFASEMVGNPTSGLIMKGLIIMMLFRGIKALKEIKA